MYLCGLALFGLAVQALAAADDLVPDAALASAAVAASEAQRYLGRREPASTYRHIDYMAYI